MKGARAARQAAGGGAGAGPSTTRHRVIDVHAHFLPKTWPDFAKRFGGENWPWLRHTGEKPAGVYGYGRSCNAMLMVGDAEFRPVTAACWDVSERIRDLDSMGVGRQIISQTPLLFQWQRDPETAAAVARDFNDLAMEMVRDPAAEGRLAALCQVPLQDVDKACAEVSRAKKSGHVGVQIGNHLGDRDLDDDELVAFLQHCAAEDFPVLVHPWEMSPMGPGNRTGDFMMGWTVGMPMETHLSITRMILGGAFDRLPESLRICFAHGGGAFPALLGRLDNAWRERSIARGRARRPPKEYMGRLYVDSAVFDHTVLTLLMETFGADRVMLGSDYPFPLGEQQIGHLVKTAPDLTERQREGVLWRNAEACFGLDPQPTLEEQVFAEELSVDLRLASRTPQPTAQPAPTAQPPPASAPTAQYTSFLLPPSMRWIGSPRPVFERRGFSTMLGQAAFTSDDSAQVGLEQRTQPRTESSGRRVGNFVGGQTTWPGQGIPLVDPSTGEVDGEVARSSPEDVAAAVKAAKEAVSESSDWPRWPLEARCEALRRLADSLEAALPDLAEAESRDTGKPYSLTKALDIPRSVANLRFFASLAPHAAGSVHRLQGPLESLSYTSRKPVGVVGIVTPWNLPLYLFTWKLAPALVMGNSIVAKPSELTPTTAALLAEMCAGAGIPPGVVNVVHGEGHVAGQALVSNPDVSAVSFTGGTATGAAVAALAAPQFKKLSLELGGKNAAVVFDDCSFEDTVAGVVRSSFLNSGQICLCSSRILVQRGPNNEFYNRFVDAFVAAARGLVVGSPHEPTTDLGPVISQAHLGKIQAAVQAARTDGGQVLCGGRAPEVRSASGGFYFEPTVIAGLGGDSSLAQTEVFGPVVTLHPFADEEEAVQLANSTRYGLSASVWTESMARAELAERLQAGTVWVNTWLNRELHMPFGGVRDSGVNREGGLHSLEFYSEATTVCVKRASRAAPPMPGAFEGGAGAGAGALGRHRVAAGGRSCGGGGGGGGGARAASSSSTPSSSPPPPTQPPSSRPAGVPKPMGDYAFSARAGALVYLAGIGPRDPDTDSVPGGPITDPETGAARDYDAAAQTRQCFANVRRVLASAGCGLSDVVDVQAFLVDMRRDFEAFNRVWAEEMAGIPATRTTIAVADLPPGGRIAVELKVVARAQDDAAQA